MKPDEGPPPIGRQAFEHVGEEEIFRHFRDAGDQSTLTFIWEVAEEVTWKQFHHLTVGEFRAVRMLAACDNWFSFSDDQILRVTGIEGISLEEIRGSAAYADIKDALLRALDRVLEPMTFDEHSADKGIQDKIFRRARFLAEHGEGKISERAIATLADRMAAPVRSGEAGTVLMFTEGAMKQLMHVESQLIELGEMPTLEGQKVLPEKNE